MWTLCLSVCPSVSTITLKRINIFEFCFRTCVDEVKRKNEFVNQPNQSHLQREWGAEVTKWPKMTPHNMGVIIKVLLRAFKKYIQVGVRDPSVTLGEWSKFKNQKISKIVNPKNKLSNNEFNSKLTHVNWKHDPSAHTYICLPAVYYQCQSS